MTIHKELSSGKWFELSLIEQMANIGTDLDRSIRWANKDKPDYSHAAFMRVLELIDLTVQDPKNRRRLKEILRTREAIIDHFIYDNEYNTTTEQWQKYFYHFNYAAALAKGR